MQNSSNLSLAINRNLWRQVVRFENLSWDSSRFNAFGTSQLLPPLSLISKKTETLTMVGFLRGQLFDFWGGGCFVFPVYHRNLFRQNEAANFALVQFFVFSHFLDAEYMSHLPSPTPPWSRLKEKKRRGKLIQIYEDVILLGIVWRQKAATIG